MRFLQPEWRSRVASTNSVLLRRAARGRAPACGSVLAALEQTRGRGRLERAWQSTPGRDLAFSFYYIPAPGAPPPVSLAMAAALGVHDCLRELGLPARVKWPNDVLVRERKICGILAEAAAGGVVVGVGLNAGMTRRSAAAVGRPATSLRIEGVRPPALPALLERCLACIGRRVDEWERGGFEALRAAWEAAAVWRGRRVRVEVAGAEKTGRLHGYGPNGELLLRMAAGRVETVWSGDLLRPSAVR